VEENRFISAVMRLAELRVLGDEIISLKQHLLTDRLENEENFSSIVTSSRKMRAVFHYIEAVSRSQKPVIITGETGVGKELIAKSIHLSSGLKGEFVAVNVAGLDDNIFSDTLFGHKKGAFTGADKERDGLIAHAAGGTLLLDEIGDLNEPSQVKLLRLLEEKMYYPIGSDIPAKSSARIIASTNRDLLKMIPEGRFRKDLYYRLYAHHIHIPPLRERTEDIPLLLDRFFDEAARSLKKKKPVPPRELITLLSNYHFPGNIRELQAIVYDAIAQHRSGTLSMKNFKKLIEGENLDSPDSPLPSQQSEDLTFSLSGRFPTLKEAEDYLTAEALKRSNGNQGIAASLLGITRYTLNKRLIRKKTG
jgi:transcriptional regulator with PAS, ATPase and Fis domain